MMLWFNEIMDDCKHALKTCNDYKGIFIPIFINAGLAILLGIFLLIFYIFLFFNIVRSVINNFEFYEILNNNLLSIIILVVITYFLIIIGASLIKAGSIKLYEKAVNNIKPQTSHFFEGIKKSFFNVFKGTLFIHLIFLLISPVLLILFLLYSATIGILSGGWGILFLASFVSVFFTAWPIITVVDNVKPIKAIGLGFKLGKRYLSPLFLLMLANIMISNYVVSLAGPWGALIAGWFLSGIVGTYFSVIILLVYNRNKENLLEG